MEFFDSLICEVSALTDTSHKINYPYNKASVWTDVGYSQVILRRDTAFELEGVGFNLVTSNDVDEGVVVIGDELDNISADLMYGIPDQDRESLLTSMRYLCDLSPEHISAYGLMLEEGTYLERHRHSFHMADDDTQYEMYLDCTEYLRSRGYHKYEISNFSRDGRHSRHNMRYWRGEEYIGFGVSAHSYFGGFRFGNSRDMDGFMRGWDICEEREYIDGEGRREEYIMLGLRLADGISAEEYRCRFGRELYDDLPTLETRIEQGFLQRRDGSISFTDKGFFVSNAILSELLTSDR